MRDMNNWRGIGRLGADPELRYTPSGTAVLNIRIGCSDDYKDKNTGNQVKQAEWVPCVAFGRQAEFLAGWLRKGARIMASGKFKTRDYEKKGEKRYVTEIHLDGDTQIIDWPPKDDQQNRQAQSRQPAPQQQAGGGHDSFDDDIPFNRLHWLEGG